MAGEWQLVEFADLLLNGTRNGVYKGKAFHGSGVKIVNMGDLFANPRLRDVPMKRVELTDSELERSLLQAGDLLFARRSLVAEGAGKCSIVMEVNEPTTFESSIIRARPDGTRANSLFLYYLFTSPQGRYLLGTILRQVAVSGITGTDLVRLKVPAPPLKEQQAIACILGALDDKIELNRRMNETLEEMAQAIFKSWFVDFDPVHAKAEHRDTGLPPEIVDLFPDSFEDSKLGEIPNGWKVGRLEDVLEQLVSGSRPRGGATPEGVPSIGAENVLGIGRYDFSKEKFIPPDFYEQLKLKGASVRPRDVLLYKDGAQIGRKTYLDCDFPHAECAINEHVLILRAKDRALQRFLFFWLDQQWMTQELISLNSNSAQPGINQAGVRGLPLLIPQDHITESFDVLITPLTKRLFQNCHKSRTLAAVRDALLPKLLSGEIKAGGVQPAEEICYA